MSAGFVAAPLSSDRLRAVLEHRRAQQSAPALAARFARLAADFPEWLFRLRAGFSLLLHGAGSKRRLLAAFCEQCLTEGQVPHLIIRGYMADLALRPALLRLADALGLADSVPQSSSAGVRELADAIVSAAHGRPDVPHCVLVVHSIDGPALRDAKCQAALSILAAAPFLRLIASVDHVNASLLWDQSVLSRFRWLWLDATTYDCYEAEVLGGESRVLSLHATRGQAYAHSTASLDSLWASLTENARRLLALVARLCADGGGEVPFWQLFREARDDLIVSSEAAMRQQMVEFHDHHLVASGAGGGDAAENVRLLVPRPLLAAFLAAQGFDGFAADAGVESGGQGEEAD